MVGFNLHVHSCKHRHKRDTQAIALVLDPAESRSTKGKLYRLNNVTAAERAKWPHTGHWKFVPFTAKENITDVHIANMLQVQNRHFCGTVGISVKGFSSLNVMLDIQSIRGRISLHQ
eukprot:7799685-Ditylum_brightwellii.AAC.1